MKGFYKAGKQIAIQIAIRVNKFESTDNQKRAERFQILNPLIQLEPQILCD